jgi:predicted membrane-bound spermidine synthase
MSKANGGEFDKMPEFIESIFNVFKMINNKAEKQNDKRLKMISLVVFNYVRKMAKDYNVNLIELQQPEAINLIPVFEYISYNNIELYDFTKIDVSDLDVTKNSDLERFVLTHVYYITQKI